jgi:hypothetical protein
VVAVVEGRDNLSVRRADQRLELLDGVIGMPLDLRDRDALVDRSDPSRYLVRPHTGAGCRNANDLIPSDVAALLNSKEFIFNH